jgi:hypothetical protein
MRLKLVLAGIFLIAALPSSPQTAPAATQGGIPFTVGYGYSEFATDWSGREGGSTIWVDWNTARMPARLHGLGVEAEARDLDFAKSGDNPNLREVTVGGGPVYHIHRFGRINPYVKFLVSFGRIDFSNRPGDLYTHDTRNSFAPGGGGDVRVFGNFYVRGDWEYQFWPDFLRGHAFNPYGLTVGVSYDLSHAHSR